MGISPEPDGDGETDRGSAGSSVLVVGANSQIGYCALTRLRKKQRRSVALVRRNLPEVDEAADKVVQADLTAVPISIPYNVRSVVHVAAIWLLPEHIEAFHRAGVSNLICFSSTAVYSKPHSVNSGEREVARRMIEAEACVAERCEALGIRWTILRPTLVYGLGMDRNIARAAKFIKRFHFYPLATGATGLRQPVHADDLAAVALKALETPGAAGKCYDVGGGERLAYREMIGRIFDVLGKPRRFVALPFLEYAAAGAGLLLRRPEVTGDVVRRMRQDLVCDNGPAAEDLDYRPRKFLAGGRADLGSNFVDTHTAA